MNIQLRVHNLIKKYHTRNPYELADYFNIEIVFHPFNPRIHGFIDLIMRHKFIVINSNLESHIQRQICAHELGHALLHKGWGFYSMMEHTLFSPSRFEHEANKFAWQLLFDEEYCQYQYGGDIDRYVREEGIVELICNT